MVGTVTLLSAGEALAVIHKNRRLPLRTTQKEKQLEGASLGDLWGQWRGGFAVPESVNEVLERGDDRATAIWRQLGE